MGINCTNNVIMEFEFLNIFKKGEGNSRSFLLTPIVAFQIINGKVEFGFGWFFWLFLVRQKQDEN